MSIRKNHPSIETVIERFSKRGDGIGAFKREETDHLVEVPFAIPGDRVQATLFRKKRGMYQSRLEAVISPSPNRKAPLCKHFASCGGCRWQQMSYRDQLVAKEEIIKNAFSDLLTEEVKVFPIVPSEHEFGYRNKMEFTFSSDKENRRFLGLMLNASKGRVLQLTECHLPNPWFVDAVEAARQWWEECGPDAYHAGSNRGSLQTLTVREGMKTGDRMINLTVSGNPAYALTKDQLQRFVVFMRQAVELDEPEKLLSIFLTIKLAKKGVKTHYFEMHLYGSDHIREKMQITTDPQQPGKELQFKISPSAFFQPNTWQAEKLYSLALRMAEIPANAVVYDLYAGTGTLGICMAEEARQVVAIELSPESSLDARENAKMNKVSNISVLTGSVEEKLAEIQQGNLFPLPDVVVVDPPRAGLEAKAIKEIVKLRPQKIVYISCNPLTQAANAQELKQEGYFLRAIWPVDQFPQTVHIENIAIFTKN